MTFLSSISMQREKIEKQFKETVQKHSNLVYTTHKTSVPGWHSVIFRFIFIFIPWASIILFNMDKFRSQHNSSKFAQQSHVYGQVGSLRSCLCLRTNFTHFLLTVGIVRELKHSMPGAGMIYSDSFADQSRSTSNTISPSLPRIFYTIRHTEIDFKLPK